MLVFKNNCEIHHAKRLGVKSGDWERFGRMKFKFAGGLYYQAIFLDYTGSGSIFLKCNSSIDSTCSVEIGFHPTGLGRI
jgi:hypothetical protein